MNTFIHAPILMIFSTLCLSVLTLLFAENKRMKNLSKVIFSINVALCVVLCAVTMLTVVKSGAIKYSIGSFSGGAGISLLADFNSSLMVTIITISFVICSFGCIATKISNYVLGFVGLAFAGLCGMCLTNDFFNFYVFLELSSISIYTLISANHYNRAACKVAFDYLIIGSIAGIFVLIGIMFIYSSTGHLNMRIISNIVSSNLFAENKNTILISKAGYAFIVIGLILKAGLYPFHGWVTKAYINSAPSVAGFLAGCVGKVALFNIYKVNQVLLINDDIIHFAELFAKIINIACVCGIVIISFNIVNAKYLRKEISLSSVMQSSFTLLCIFSFNSTMFNAAMWQMLAHTISIGTIFTSIELSSFWERGGKTIYETKKQTSTEVLHYECTNFHRRIHFGNPLVKLIFIMLFLNIAGYPITIGFFAKLSMMSTAILLQEFALFAAIAASAIFSMVYIWKIIERKMFFDNN